MNGKKPKSGTITFKTASTNNTTNTNQITYSGVVLEGMEYELKEDGTKISKTYEPPIPATDQDYRGYYADVDGDGEADGVIYADLGANITYPVSGDYYNDKANLGQNNGTYSYTKETGLKEYTVSKETYKKNDGFGTKPIISVKSGSTGNPRFYVMALENFTTEAYADPEDSSKDYPAYTTYYWYNGAFGHMSPLITSNDFGQGKENTRKMIAKWNAAGTSEGYTDSPQNNQDIWKHVQTKYQQGWYIPSLGEWAAFADYFTSKTENKLTSNYETGSYVANSGNYNSLYGLSSLYWSSSQYYTNYAWYVNAGYGYMPTNIVSNNYAVRLGATF